ncbi:unnamed protein product [Hymenolepis diminuta]|uniref:Uncharacterized protein n=1 Tax=Hymenolepis diminuta TaxID=6216 RepID=A0A564Y1A5_HYMDI|nr:unnamed protein product [Hymenolepis diminuta]
MKATEPAEVVVVSEGGDCEELDGDDELDEPAGGAGAVVFLSVVLFSDGSSLALHKTAATKSRRRSKRHI